MEDKEVILKNLSSMSVPEIGREILNGTILFDEVVSKGMLGPSALISLMQFVLSHLTEEREHFDQFRRELEKGICRLEEERNRFEWELRRLEEEYRNLQMECERHRARLDKYEAILRGFERIPIEDEGPMPVECTMAAMRDECNVPERSEAQDLTDAPAFNDGVFTSRKVKQWLPLPNQSHGAFWSFARKNAVFAALYAPTSTQINQWFRVQVHLYEEGAANAVHQKAKKIDEKAELMGYNPLSMKLRKGMQVNAELTIYDKGVRVNRASQSLVWSGRLTSVVFVAKADDPSLKSIAGDVVLSVDNAPVGVLTFSMEVSSSPDETTKLGSAKEFKKVFISYAHEDVTTASVVASAYRAQGIPYFFDHHSLEAGSVFDAEIRRNIADSDLFMLLWSKNAAKSEYVEKEYLHAMQYAYPQRDKESATLEFRPFFIDPIAEPPAKLKPIYNFSSILVEH